MLRIVGRGGVVVGCLAALAGACSAAEDGKTRGLPAFPGAEGYGAVAVGGRGGKVIHVTTLKSDGPGSLQAACDAEGPRIVVFDVSGVIVPPNVDKGRRYLAIRHSNITIAGQTAPGAGVTIAGMVSALRGTKVKPVRDVVLRFLRIRPTAARKGGRNLRALELSNSARIICDHVSGSWSIDDCFDLYTATEATVQWCTSEESDIWLEGGDEPHNFGMITGYGGPRPITVHHTLLANHRERTPACGSYPTDFRNNVIYNSGSGMGLLVRASYADAFAMNIVGNFVKAGPGGIIGNRIYLPPRAIGRGGVGPYRKGIGRFFLDGNYFGPAGGYVRPWLSQAAGKAVVDRPFDLPPVETQPAPWAQDLVLASAGCLPRDAVSTRTVREVLTGTGEWGRHTPGGGLMAGLTPGRAPTDTDRDGMPDAWERSHGLDPKDASDAGKTVPKGASRGDRHMGYTYVEFYVNSLADRLTAEALTRWRLEPPPARPWAKPALGLSPMATPHGSLDEIVAALADQNRARQASADRRVKYATAPAWFAVQQLSRMGDAAKPAVPALVKLLGGDDTRQATFAAWALGAIGPAASDAAPALAAAMKKDWAVKGGKWTWSPVGFAAWALGRIGAKSPAAVSALVAVLTDGKHPRAAEPALYALRRAGAAAQPALPVLLRHLDSPHAVGALANIGAPAVPGLTKALSDSRAHLRLGAVEALGLIGPRAADAAPKVAALLSDKHVPVRVRAARAAAAMAPASKAVLGALVEALGDGDMAVRQAAAESLGRCGPAAGDAVGALSKLLVGQARDEVRVSAAAALGRVGPAGIGALKEALTGKAPRAARRSAARALGGAGSAGEEVLVTALADKDAGVRREAAWALARIPAATPEAKAALTAALDEPDYVVPVAAAAALKAVRSKAEKD